MTSEPRTLSTIEALAAAGLVDRARVPELEAVARRYAVAVTPAIATVLAPGDADDPLARQFIPDAAELQIRADEAADPIGDAAHSPVPGVVHRYPDRVLLKVASVCPVYCRFCFRRETVGPALGEPLTADDLTSALDYIRATPAIWEVILTGGDPFVLSPRRIADVTTALGQIPHVKILRWHTRVPVVDPDRVTDDLVSALKASDKTVFIGLHTNNARELTTEAQTAIAKLVDAGIPLVSQTVLLKGVNDTADALEALMRALVEARVKPYYLHHGDLAPGTAHFRTTIAEGQALVDELRRRLSGLAMPTYVLDIPGAFGKVPIQAAKISQDGGRISVSDPNGGTHVYEDACAAPYVP